MWDSEKLPYAGPGILEVTEDQIVVWSQDRQEEVVRWKLRHIRMFKAKQDHFQVMAGRLERSFSLLQVNLITILSK